MLDLFKKNNNGRPPLFQSPEAMIAKVEEYFEDCTENDTPLTVTGLALYLGYDSRQSLYDNEKREDFSYIIKRAKMIIENDREQRLTKSGEATTGIIFALKNMGWTDKTETDITTNGKDLNNKIDLKSLSDEEIATLTSIMEKSNANQEDN